MAQIDGKEAAVLATQYFIGLTGSTPSGLAIEEIEKETEGNKEFWLVTLGYNSSDFSMQLPPPRYYKRFNIDATTKEVVSMTIRKI